MSKLLKISGFFAVILLLLVSSFVAFLPQQAQAAGETYTWTSNTSLTATGGNLQGTTTFTANAPAIPTFFATMTHQSGCQFRVQMFVLANNASGRLSLPQSAGGPGDGITNRCSVDIAQSYNGQTVPIGGTRPGPGDAPETPLQRNVSVTLYSPTPAAQSPASVTFTWKNASGQTVTTTTAAQNGDSAGNPTDPNLRVVRYETSTQLDPGNYSVCPSAVITECRNFAKVKYQAASITMGESLSNRTVVVSVDVVTSRALDQPYSVGPTQVSLIKTDNTGQTLTMMTDSRNIPAENDTSVVESTVTLKATFANDPNLSPGEYRACVTASNTCETFTKDATNPGAVTIRLTGDAATNLGNTITTPTKTCAQEAKGIGWLFCPLITTMEQASQKLTEFIIGLLALKTDQMFTDPETSPAYKAAWAGFRNISYAILVIIGLIMVASQVFNLEIMSAYTLRKMLPGLIAAVVAITFSWDIIEFLYNMSNAAAYALADIIQAPFQGVESVAGAVEDNTLQDLFGAAALGILSAIGIAGIAIYAALGGVTVILALIASFLISLFSMYVLLEARNVAAVLVLVSSPIPIICAAFEPVKAVYVFAKGILIAIIVTVPGVAVIMTFAGVGSLVAAAPGGPGDILTAIIILIAGIVMVWTLFLQMDKVTGFLGNISSKATGGFKKFLGDYQSNTVKKNFGLWKQGELETAAGTATRELGLRVGAGEHLSKTTGKGMAGAVLGSEAGRLAAQNLELQRAAKMVEHDAGRNGGNDELMEVIASGKARNREEAARMLYNLRKQRFDEKQARHAANGWAFTDTWDAAHERHEADLQTESAEITFGGAIGKKTSMRSAAFRALMGSSTAFNDIATRYATGEGKTDGLTTKEGRAEMVRRMEALSGHMIADGLMTEVDTTQAKKKNNQRTEISGNSFASAMRQDRKVADRIRQGGSDQITDDEIKTWISNTIKYTTAPSKVANRGESVDVQASFMYEELEDLVRSSAAQIQPLLQRAETDEAEVRRVQAEIAQLLQRRQDEATRGFDDPTVRDQVLAQADADIVAKRQTLQQLNDRFKVSRKAADEAQFAILQHYAVGSAESAVLASYANPDTARRFDENFMRRQAPGQPQGVTNGEYIERLRQSSDVFARLERTYRQNADAQLAAAAVGGQQPQTPGQMGPPTP